MTEWYRQGADVQRLLHNLSVYLGHAQLAATQVYLTMTPSCSNRPELGSSNTRAGRRAPMRDPSLLGPWIRRFLMEHVTSERNLARNTQLSYRDTLRLLLPIVAKRTSKPIDRLVVDDISVDHVRQFLNDLEVNRGCGIATRNQRLAAVHALRDSSACMRRSSLNGADKCGRCCSRKLHGRWSRTWRRRRWMLFSRPRT